MSLRTTPIWLKLTRKERNNFIQSVLGPILAKYNTVSLRFYDAEAFAGRCTDLAVWETHDLQQYYFLMDALRDTPLFSAPYFEVVDIIPAIEDGFREYDEALNVAGLASQN